MIRRGSWDDVVLDESESEIRIITFTVSLHACNLQEGYLLQVCPSADEINVRGVVLGDVRPRNVANLPAGPHHGNPGETPHLGRTEHQLTSAIGPTEKFVEDQSGAVRAEHETETRHTLIAIVLPYSRWPDCSSLVRLLVCPRRAGFPLNRNRRVRDWQCGGGFRMTYLLAGSTHCAVGLAEKGNPTVWPICRHRRLGVCECGWVANCRRFRPPLATPSLHYRRK